MPIIHSAAARLPLAQWTNAGWLAGSVTALRKPSTMAGSGDAPLTGRCT